MNVIGGIGGRTIERIVFLHTTILLLSVAQISISLSPSLYPSGSIPLNSPLNPILRPSGRFEAVNVYGGVPADGLVERGLRPHSNAVFGDGLQNEYEYFSSTVASGSFSGTSNIGGRSFTDRLRSNGPPEFPLESAISNLNENDESDVTNGAVPIIEQPVNLRVPGNPESELQVYGGVPPLGMMFHLYGSPECPTGKATISLPKRSATVTFVVNVIVTLGEAEVVVFVVVLVGILGGSAVTHPNKRIPNTITNKINEDCMTNLCC